MPVTWQEHLRLRLWKSLYLNLGIQSDTSLGLMYVNQSGSMSDSDRLWHRGRSTILSSIKHWDECVEEKCRTYRLVSV